MAYELWSLDTRNIVGDYDSEEAALVVVNDALEAHGREAVIDLALAHEDRRGRTRLIAQGDDLIARAQAAAAPAPRALGFKGAGKIPSLGTVREAARSGAWAFKKAAGKKIERSVSGKAVHPAPSGKAGPKHKPPEKAKSKRD